MPKMLPLIMSCKGCPNRRYGTGGRYECMLVDETIPDPGKIPSFCPLPDYPASSMAAMETMIRHLQQPFDRTMVATVLAHIAAKFRTITYADGGQINFRLEDDTMVLLRYDTITKVEVGYHEWCIHFRSEASEYSVVANQEPLLRKKVTLGGGGEGWQNCRLAQ